MNGQLSNVNKGVLVCCIDVQSVDFDDRVEHEDKCGSNRGCGEFAVSDKRKIHSFHGNFNEWERGDNAHLSNHHECGDSHLFRCMAPQVQLLLKVESVQLWEACVEPTKRVEVAETYQGVSKNVMFTATTFHTRFFIFACSQVCIAEYFLEI